jgi:hypothetical protein
MSISETLALGALSKSAYKCPYSTARHHLRECVCRGTPENTRILASGSRTCRECRRLASQKSNWRLRGLPRRSQR